MKRRLSARTTAQTPETFRPVTFSESHRLTFLPVRTGRNCSPYVIPMALSSGFISMRSMTSRSFVAAIPRCGHGGEAMSVIVIIRYISATAAADRRRRDDREPNEVHDNWFLRPRRCYCGHCGT